MQSSYSYSTVILPLTSIRLTTESPMDPPIETQRLLQSFRIAADGIMGVASMLSYV